MSLLGKSISGIYLIHPICALMAVMFVARGAWKSGTR